MSVYDYIAEMASAILKEKPAELRGLLSISPGQEIGEKRAHFPDPGDIDLYTIPEKFHAVVRSYIKLMRSIYIAADLKASFVDINNLLVSLNRAAESQSNWICPALINCSDDLITVYKVRTDRYPEQTPAVGQPESEFQQDTPLEVVANTINRSFKICLTDKNLDRTLSKRQSIDFFLAALMKIYFKLEKLLLAKSVEKALVATGYQPPSPDNRQVQYRKYSVTYLYYSALLSLNDSDFSVAEKKLDTAMDFLAYYRKPAAVKKQTEKILMLLVPLKMTNSRSSLARKTWDEFPSLAFVFRDRLFAALNCGNLRLFDHWFHAFQKVFLKRYIYILILSLRELCILRLFEKTFKIYGELGNRTPHIVPFRAFRAALDISISDDKEAPKSGDRMSDDDYGEVECLLANFILKCYVRGYLSHSNKCIVFSKASPFPVFESK